MTHRGWSREINYTGLIRKEVCSDCIKSTSPNITQTLSTPAKLFQSGLSCLKLSVTSFVEVGLAIFLRVSDGMEGKGGRKKKGLSLHFHWLWVFSHYSKKHQFVPPTSHSTEMASWSPSQSTKKQQMPRKVIKSLLKSWWSGQKHRRVRAHRLFNLGCYARKNDIPSLLMHTLYKQHNVTHSSEWESKPDRQRERERGKKSRALLYK